ncbi:MAG: putative zinc-binding metallopeptidase [Chitinophagaceae bacterium]
MRKIFLIAVLFSAILFSCRKSDENLDISMDDYPVDIPATSSALDAWLKDSFNIPWNINVEYRFDRYESEYPRNIAPIDLVKVKPSMEAILKVFMAPYTNVTGSTVFGKKYFPKQWVLYGSGSYNTDNTYILGTASNGVRVNLYDLNNFSVTDGENVRRRMRTVHHEFTHVLNQTIPVTNAYELISQDSYDPDWAGMTEDSARSRGFISPYASSEPMEDFAEMVAHIVVQGPVWYKNYLAIASESGKSRLKQKESIVYEYLKNNFNVDLYQLQTEVQNALKTNYGVTDPADLTLSMPYRLNNVATLFQISMTLNSSYYTTYGTSASYYTMLNSYIKAVEAAQSYGYTIKSIYIVFNSRIDMFTLQVGFGTPTGTTYWAYYDMNIKVNPVTGATVFTKSLPEGTAATSVYYTYGQYTYMLKPFESYLLPYFTNREFVAAYLPSTVPAASTRTYGGFYVKTDPTNFFYGIITSL